jgi:hypothetical protein
MIQLTLWNRKNPNLRDEKIDPVFKPPGHCLEGCPGSPQGKGG